MTSPLLRLHCLLFAAALLLALAACGSEPASDPRHPCELDNGGCGDHASCTRDGAEARCVCDDGFMASGGECVELDECAFALDACDDRATCTNTQGSYTCACPAGELGDGTFCGRPWRSIAAGGWQTCAVRPEGSLWCWGSAADGVLGTGATDGRSTGPVRVGTDTDWDRVFASTYSACAQKHDGALWCWGRGVYGIFANGTTENSAVPVRTAASHTFVSIALGMEHTCGLEADGTLSCWGVGREGRLGDGHFPLPTEDSRALEPRAIAGRWRSVSSRHQHTCAIREDRTMWCWGSNTYGELGDGTTDPRASPTQVGTDADWAQVSAGLFTTCGLKADGALWCWGRNARFDRPAGTDQFEPRPVRVWAGEPWTRVHVGAGYACGEKEDGSVWCGGTNAYGQLGAGLVGNLSAEPQRVGDTWAAVAVGQNHSCALRPEGVLQCWGLGANGALGTGEAEPRSRVRPVSVP